MIYTSHLLFLVVVAIIVVVFPTTVSCRELYEEPCPICPDESQGPCCPDNLYISLKCTDLFDFAEEFGHEPGVCAEFQNAYRNPAHICGGCCDKDSSLIQGSACEGRSMTTESVQAAALARKNVNNQEYSSSSSMNGHKRSSDRTKSDRMNERRKKVMTNRVKKGTRTRTTENVDGEPLEAESQNIQIISI
jgi:hypothetical protein